MDSDVPTDNDLHELSSQEVPSEDDLPSIPCKSEDVEAVSNSVDNTLAMFSATVNSWGDAKKHETHDEYTRRVWAFMKGCFEDGCFNYTVDGHHITNCNMAAVLGLSRTTLAKLEDWMKAGEAEPPRDLRHTRKANRHHTEKEQDVQAFFLWAYNNVGEHLPLARDDAAQNVCIADADAPPTDNAPALCLEVHRLPPMNKTMMYELYLGRGGKAKRSLFHEIYRRDWKDKLPTRHISSFTMCNTCAELKLARARATTPEENSKVSPL